MKLIRNKFEIPKYQYKMFKCVFVAIIGIIIYYSYDRHSI